MIILNREDLKKYAINYLKRYNSSKNNLIKILNRKLYKFGIKDSITIKKYRIDIIDIVDNLEKNNIINDENFANSKAYNYINMGKSLKFIKFNLIKKGIEKNNIDKAIKKLTETIPDLEMQGAINFARKKKLGKYGNKEKKESDLHKMSRAGFSYGIALKVLGYKEL